MPNVTPIPRPESDFEKMDPRDPAKLEHDVFKSIQDKQLRFKSGPAGRAAGVYDANGYRRDTPPGTR